MLRFFYNHFVLIRRYLIYEFSFNTNSLKGLVNILVWNMGNQETTLSCK